jgi:hypothetical protein
VRVPLSLALSLACASLCAADRLITIPLGRKIPFQNVKFDSFTELSSADSWDRFIGIGISPEFELDYHGERFRGGKMQDTFDFSYNYVAPIMNQAPGISVGVEDMLNRTVEGRRVYLAATWRMSVDSIGRGNLPLDATIGVSQGSRALPFVGVSIPFAQDLRFLVEDDGTRIATGFEWRGFGNMVGAKLFVRDQAVMVGANLTLRF